MKAFLFLVLISLAPSFAQAYWFPVHPQYHVTPLQVTASIYNSTGYTIYCEGRLEGLTQSGFISYANMSTWVYPGNWGYAYVYTHDHNPFFTWGGNFYCTY
jgi:hypothetical protein